jgi:hypothetical protein
MQQDHPENGLRWCWRFALGRLSESCIFVGLHQEDEEPAFIVLKPDLEKAKFLIHNPQLNSYV